MNLFEFESKKILFYLNLNILNSYLTKKKFFIKNFIYKIQIYSNYRKKLGGIKILQCLNEVDVFFKLINKKINNKKVKTILIEKNIIFEKEFYISFYFKNDFLIFCFNNTGGINIENQKEINFLKIKIKNFFHYYIIYDFLINLKIKKKIIKIVINIIIKIFNIIKIKKIFLIEINPLVIKKDKIFLLDCKIILDKKPKSNFSDKISNFLNINYIELNGLITTIVNGAGLALKTMDLLYYNKINCSNFLDLSGTITEQNINKLIKFILLKKKIKVLFINIFGGIVSCDKIISAILNLFYYNFKFKILVKLNGINSKKTLSNIINIKNIIIIKNDFDMIKKCKILYV